MANKTGNIRKLSNHETSVFCSQMAMLIKSGIAPFEGVNIMLSDTTEKEGRRILEQMSEIVNRGEKLHTAMEETGVFPEYVTHMITIGEESGHLDTVLDALSNFYEREDNLRDTISSALSYPLVMIAIMFLVVMVMITRVLPIFAQVFAQLGTRMNAFSESLLNLGTQMNQSSIIIVVVLAALTLFFLYLARTESGNRQFKQFAENFGPTRRLGEEIAAGRFASGMALTLTAGMDTIHSMELVDKLVENKTVSAKIAKAREMIDAGDSFPDAMEATSFFTKLYNRMILVGFRTGSMDIVMQQIAERYQKETDRKIYNIISIVEPTLIIILSIIVGMILLSVILPLMGIMSGIG